MLKMQAQKKKPKKETFKISRPEKRMLRLIFTMSRRIGRDFSDIVDYLQEVVGLLRQLGFLYGKKELVECSEKLFELWETIFYQHFAFRNDLEKALGKAYPGIWDNLDKILGRKGKT